MKRTWKIRLKKLWCALRGHPGSRALECAFECARCDELDKQLKMVMTINRLELQPSLEHIELEKLRINSLMLRGQTTITFGHINGMVMVYLSEFTLNFAMDSEQIDWFIAGLRAEQEKLKNEASTG